MNKNFLTAVLIVLSLILLISLITIGFLLSKSDAGVPNIPVGNITTDAAETGSPTTSFTPVLTDAPAQSTEKTVITEAPRSEAPILTTAPIITTEKPIVTTEAPVITTLKPIVTTAPQINTIPQILTDTPTYTTAPVITTQKPIITTSPITTKPVLTEIPIITEAPITTEQTTAVVTTSAPEKTYPNVSGSFSWSTSNKYWQIFVDWETVSRTDTSASIKFTTRFYGTSLSIGARDAVLTINGTEYPFTVAKVNQAYSSGKRYNIVVNEQTITVPLKNGCADVSVVMDYKANYTFSSVYYKTITVSGTASIK